MKKIIYILLAVGIMGGSSMPGFLYAAKSTQKEAAQKHICPECNKEFTRKDNLTVHINNIHRGEKHVCAECNKEFTQKGNLYRHIRRNHGNTEVYNCTLCNKSYKSSDGLSKHVNTKHKNIIYPCEHCGKEFTQNSHSKRHMKKCQQSSTNTKKRAQRDWMSVLKTPAKKSKINEVESSSIGSSHNNNNKDEESLVSENREETNMLIRLLAFGSIVQKDQNL